MKVNKSGTLARVLSPTYVDFMHSHQPNRCTSREKSHADFRLPTLINSHSRLIAASICLPSVDPVNKRSSSALKSNPCTELSSCNTKSGSSFSKFHSIAVLSDDPDASIVPMCDRAKHRTTSVCPLSSWTCLPVYIVRYTFDQKHLKKDRFHLRSKISNIL